MLAVKGTKWIVLVAQLPFPRTGMLSLNPLRISVLALSMRKQIVGGIDGRAYVKNRGKRAMSGK